MPERYKRTPRPGGYIERDPELPGSVKVLDLVEGEAPHLTWTQYEEIINEIPKSHHEYGYKNVEISTEPAIKNIRKMWNRDEESFVVLAPGSHEILERSIIHILPYIGDVTFKAVSPHFPEVARIATSAAAHKAGTVYTKTETHLSSVIEGQSPTADAVYKMIKELEEIPSRRTIAVYASGVNSFTGEMVPTDVWHKLAEVCDRKGFYFFADEAVDDIRPQEESLIHQTDKKEKMLVSRSPSKIAGIGDDRIAYAIGNKEWEKIYSPHKRVLNLSWFQKELANRIFDPEIYLPRIKEMIGHITFLNEFIMEGLDNAKIPTYPTSIASPFFAIKGKDEGLYNRLIRSGVAGVSGARAGTHSGLSEKDVRFATAPGPMIDTFLFRVTEAWNARPKTYFVAKPEGDERIV